MAGRFLSDTADGQWRGSSEEVLVENLMESIVGANLSASFPAKTRMIQLKANRRLKKIIVLNFESRLGLMVSVWLHEVCPPER